MLVCVHWLRHQKHPQPRLGVRQPVQPSRSLRPLFPGLQLGRLRMLSWPVAIWGRTHVGSVLGHPVRPGRSTPRTSRPVSRLLWLGRRCPLPGGVARRDRLGCWPGTGDGRVLDGRSLRCRSTTVWRSEAQGQRPSAADSASEPVVLAPLSGVFGEDHLAAAFDQSSGHLFWGRHPEHASLRELDRRLHSFSRRWSPPALLGPFVSIAVADVFLLVAANHGVRFGLGNGCHFAE